MEDLRKLQEEIKIKLEVYEEIIQSVYCEEPMVTYLHGKAEALEDSRLDGRLAGILHVFDAL